VRVRLMSPSAKWPISYLFKKGGDASTELRASVRRIESRDSPADWLNSALNDRKAETPPHEIRCEISDAECLLF
jgi:hypothetical protein